MKNVVYLLIGVFIGAYISNSYTYDFKINPAYNYDMPSCKLENKTIKYHGIEFIIYRYESKTAKPIFNFRTFDRIGIEIPCQ